MQLSLLHPAVLWALLLLPPLAVLLMVLPRSRRVAVGSLMFWRDDAADSTRDAATWRRRISLAAVLLLAALALLIVALAGPRIYADESAGPAGVILVDRSPSMMMLDDQDTTRLERRRAATRDFLASLPVDLPLRVVLLPPPRGTEPAAGAASEVGRLASAGLASSALMPDDLGRRAMVEHDRTGAPVVVFTDIAPWGDPNSPDAAPPGIFTVATGGASRNVGLVDASVVRRGRGGVALVRLMASGDGGQATRRVRVIGPSGMLAAATLDVPLGEKAWTLPLAGSVGDRLTVQLDGADGFARDSQVKLQRVGVIRQRVGLVGRAEPALLRLCGVMGLDVIAYDDAAGPPPQDVAVTLFVGRLPADGFRGRAIIIDPPESFGPLARTDRTAGPGPWRIAAAQHPLVASLPGEAVTMRSWPVFTLTGEALPVLESADGAPLVVAYESPPGEPRVAVLFDTGWSNAQWNAAMVVFWANCLEHVAAVTAASDRWVPTDLAAVRIAQIEGRQTTGPAVDQSAAARAAMLAYERTTRRAATSLWPALAVLAAVLLLARVWVMR